MERVLIFHFYLVENEYEFLGRIDAKYVIPEDTTNACFYEGFILNNQDDETDMEDYRIIIPALNITVGYNIEERLFKTIKVW
jgi:hypothetical protein